jgi:hypothetical protein
MFEDLFQTSMNGMNTVAMDSQQAEDLLKTLQVGHANGTAAPGSLAGGAALQAESVDATVKSVTYDQKNLVMWPSIPQDRAYSLVEQYNRLSSYGDGGTPYITESGSPAMNDMEVHRHAQKVVFFSTRRGVSLASTLVRNLQNQDAEARETQSGTLWILEKLERELYKGLADFSNSGAFDGSLNAIPSKLQNLNLAGLEMQIRNGDSDYSAQSAAFDGFGGTNSVIVSVSDVIDETAIEDLSVSLSENFGRPTMLDWAPKTMSDFVRQFFPKERVNALGVLDGRAGYVVRTLATTAGDIGLRPNVFLKPKQLPKSRPDRAGVPNAPAGLTNNAAASVASGSGNSMDQASSDSSFASGDIFEYFITACNEQGENSSGITSVQVTLSAAGNKVTFKITDPSSGNTPTHYAVYRTGSAGTGSKQFIGYVARTGSSTTFTDNGKRSPGAYTAYMFDMRPEVMIWKQLAPMLRINQAPVGTAKEFLLWLAGTCILFSPRFCGVLENIQRSA